MTILSRLVRVFHREDDMAGTGKYIYGVINSDKALQLFTPKDLLDEEKSKAKETYTIPYRSISAVVCDLEIVDYTQMRKDALAKLLVRHQKVIEKIMGLEYTIIPMRLGTFAQDESEVKDILNKGYSLIKDIMEKVSDKVEIDLVATWSNFTLVLKEVGEEKEIKELKEKLLANSKGITAEDQMKVGVRVKKALDKKREEHAYLIQVLLNAISQDFKVHELMDDKMVANFAFLINKTKQKDFDRRVEGLNTKFADKLNFRCIGPLPSYSFYTLEIRRMQFEEIDWARKKLGLNDFTTKEEVKKAYRKLSFSFHPDKNVDTPGVEKEFNDLTKAYKTLVDYCLAVEQGQGKRYSFKEEDFKENSILVRVLSFK